MINPVEHTVPNQATESIRQLMSITTPFHEESWFNFVFPKLPIDIISFDELTFQNYVFYLIYIYIKICTEHSKKGIRNTKRNNAPPPKMFQIVTLKKGARKIVISPNSAVLNSLVLFSLSRQTEKFEIII